MIADETTIIRTPVALGPVPAGTPVSVVVSDLGQALTGARNEIQAAIASMRPGETSVALQTAVNAINDISNEVFHNDSSPTTAPGGPYIGNKCNVFVGMAISTASSVSAGSANGYPLDNGKFPSANYLGDSRDPHKLKNLSVVTDGSLRIGDVVAYRHNNASAQNSGHSAIYIGGGAVVYAGGPGGGVPIANTLKALDSGMSSGHFPRTVRRFSGR